MQTAWPERADAYDPDRFSIFEPSACRYHYPVGVDDLRPGETVSGPTLMRLADTVAYALILGHLGDAALAVTTSLSIDFLRRPVGPVIVTDCQMVKLGRSLAVFRVAMVSTADDGEPRLDRPEAVANVTYSLALT